MVNNDAGGHAGKENCQGSTTYSAKATQLDNDNMTIFSSEIHTTAGVNDDCPFKTIFVKERNNRCTGCSGRLGTRAHNNILDPS